MAFKGYKEGINFLANEVPAFKTAVLPTVRQAEDLSEVRMLARITGKRATEVALDVLKVFDNRVAETLKAQRDAEKKANAS